MLILFITFMITVLLLIVNSDPPFSKTLLLEAENGDMDAQFSIGYAYSTGNGIPINKEQAVQWYRLAAEQGHAVAMQNLGFLYYKGEGIYQDYNEAFRWWEQAANLGIVSSINNLGECYENGFGVTQSYDLALKWYKKAAEMNCPEAMYEVGKFYLHGIGVSKDIKEAYYWLYTAVVTGSGEAASLAMELAREAQRELTKKEIGDIKGDAWPRIEEIFEKCQSAISDNKEIQNNIESDGVDQEGDGSSIESAIKIFMTNTRDGVSAEYQYIKQVSQKRKQTFTKGNQSLIYKDDIPYDMVEVIWDDGKKEFFYFNIVEFYGR